MVYNSNALLEPHLSLDRFPIIFNDDFKYISQKESSFRPFKEFNQ